MAPSKSQGFVEPVNPPPTSFLSSKTTSCHTSHQNSDRLKYFRAMELLLQPPTNPNVKLSHTVVVGDLVSYTHDGKHEIGQVLTFYERKSRESGTIDGFAVLRPFLHWDNIKYQPNNKRNRRMLSVNDTKQISQSMRFDVALFEQTDIVHTVNLEQIHIGKLITSSVPGISAMADARNFRPQRIDASGTRGKDNLQVWEMNRIILYRLEAAAADEQTYHAIPINDWKNYNLDFSQTVPGPLRRGWDCLENAVLVDDMAKEFQSHVKAILAEDRCLLERIQTEPQVAESEIKPAAVESLNRKPVREETKHRQKSKSKQAKRGVKRASTIKNAKKTAPKKQKTGRQGVTGSDVDEDCESDDDSQYSEQSINVQAVSDSIYTLSGKVRGDASKPALHFFTQIQLSTDKYATDTSLHGKMASHWILSVGDLIAVHCLEATLPSTGKADKGKQNKKPWFPFARPWSAAQVVSIYKVEGASQFLMELRWLYRPHELEPNVQANLTSDMRQQLFDGKKRSGTVNIHTMVEADEYVTEAPVESALGRVKVMGTDSPRIAKAVPGLSTDMMPQIFVSIPYVYRMQYDETTIRPAKGWESYGSTIQTGPLHQALFCEKGWPGRKEGKQLRKKYKAFFVKKYDLQTGEDVRERRDEIGDAEEDTDAIMAEQMGTLIHYHREWPVELKEQKTFAVSTDHSRCLHTVDVGKNRTREYLHAIHVPVIRKRCDARATASKAVASEQFWKLQIGDFVCLMDDKASREAVAKGQNPWYPFLGPWSVCQVLCIYQEKTRRGSPSVPLLEIRRFFHRNDMPSNVQAWMPPPADKQRDSCFETNHVESDVPALQVLGRAVLFLGRHIDSASSNESVDSPVPSTSCRCSFFYDVSRQTFQPLFCSSKTPAGWLMRMLKRGFKASALLKEDLVLKENVASNFNLIEDVFDLDKMLQDDDKEDDPVPVPLETSTSVDTSLFLSVPLRPEWSVYVDSEYICAASDRENLIWQARVGDVVAVRTLADECSGEAAFPFSVAWMVGQVLSLFRSTGGDMQAEIRWLDRRSDPVNQTIDTVFEPQTSKTVELSVTDLLSPVTLVDNERAQTPWNISFPFLPLIVMKCGGQAHKEVATERIPFVANSMVARGLILSSRYGELDRTSIFGQIAGDDPSLKEREENETVTANSLFSPQKTYIDQDPTTPKDLSTKAGLLSLSLPSNPFHCDKSARIEFFKSLGLVVPQSLSAFGQMKELGKPWRVKSGDAVILQYDVGKARVKSADCAPFKMPWGIAEVVTIYKHLDKDADDLKLASPNFDIFKPDCIQFVAKKTASMSGDIRKAFTICRTAAELVLEDIESGKIKDERPQVTMSYLFAVSKDTFNSPQSNRMNTLAAFEVLVIVALASLTKSTGREQGGFDVDEIVTKMEAMVNALGDNQYIPPPSLTETLQLLAQLGTAHLISLQTPRNASITRAGTGGPWPLSKLLVDETVVWVALKDTPHNPLVKRYLKR